jgi:site-specific recombinase XerC
MTIDQALERFLVQLEADGRSPHTIGQYRRHVRALSRWARDAGPRSDRIEDLDHEAIAAFLASPCRPSTAFHLVRSPPHPPRTTARRSPAP